MKDTVGSIRTFLIVVGVLGTLTNFSTVSAAQLHPVMRVVAAIALAASLGYILAGGQLRAWIVRAPGRIHAAIALGMVASGANVGALVVYANLDATGSITGLVASALAVLVSLYLFASVRRLSREERAKVAVAPPTLGVTAVPR
jgi:hypothetical protein